MSHLKTAAIPDISLLFLDLFYGDGVLPAEYPARLQSIAILPLFQAAVEGRPVASAVVALRTKRKIFSYKIQKPLLKRNLKKDA